MNRMRELREEIGISMKEAARQLKLPYTTYVNYEKGFREPNSETLIDIADFFDTSIDYLLFKSNIRHSVANGAMPNNIIPMPEMRKIPLIGCIACGAPILADEHIEDYIDIPKHIHADFALTCKGDSMINARIFDGDIVYIRKQDTVENGEIAAVLIEDEATLKRVRLFDDHISLDPENPQYRPIVYWGDEMNSVRILGKAVAFTSCVR